MSIATASRFGQLARVTLPVAPLALAAASSAQAQIVYTNPADVTIFAGGAIVYFDLGKLGAGGSASTTNFGTSNFKLWFGYSNSSDTPSIRLTGGGGYTPVALTDNDQFARRFAANEGIGAAVFVAHYGNGPAINEYGANNANWPAGTSGYIGMRLPASSGPGHVDYGWARVSYNSDKSLTLYDFAYESSGAAIAAGDVGSAIPEPSTYAALAGLLAGSAALYRRRQLKSAV